MSRSIGNMLVVLLVAGCTPTPAPTATSRIEQPASPVAAQAAALSITGSGRFCGPWWYGCGAVLAVEAPGWTLPDDWTASADDTTFAVDHNVASDGPARITGVRHQGMDRIEPGSYRFVLIETRSSDSASPATVEASILCSADAEIPPGTRAASVDVELGSGCTVEVSIDRPTPASSS